MILPSMESFAQEDCHNFEYKEEPASSLEETLIHDIDINNEERSLSLQLWFACK